MAYSWHFMNYCLFDSVGEMFLLFEDDIGPWYVSPEIRMYDHKNVVHQET